MRVPDDRVIAVPAYRHGANAAARWGFSLVPVVVTAILVGCSGGVSDPVSLELSDVGGWSVNATSVKEGAPQVAVGTIGGAVYLKTGEAKAQTYSLQPAALLPGGVEGLVALGGKGWVAVGDRHLWHIDGSGGDADTLKVSAAIQATAPGPDEGLLLVGGSRGLTCVDWNDSPPKQVKVSVGPNRLRHLVAGPWGVALADARGEITRLRWGAEGARCEGATVVEVAPLPKLSSGVVALSADDQWIYVATTGGDIYTYPIETEAVTHWALRGSVDAHGSIEALGAAGGVVVVVDAIQAVAFDAQGKQLWGVSRLESGGGGPVSIAFELPPYGYQWLLADHLGTPGKVWLFEGPNYRTMSLR